MNLKEFNEVLNEKNIKKSFNQEVVFEILCELEDSFQSNSKEVLFDKGTGKKYYNKNKYKRLGATATRALEAFDYIGITLTEYRNKYKALAPKDEVELSIDEYYKLIVKNYRDDKNNKSGIYGITINGEIVYVGMTIRSFADRWGEHIRCAYKPTEKDKGLYQQKHLYQAMRENKGKIKFIVLYENKKDHTLNQRELQCVELGMITSLQPKFNYDGIKTPYTFTAKR